jgi:predicted amidohydrolase YtcJ
MCNKKKLDAKEGSWILGGGWNNDFWGGELPSASWIDEISPRNPVWLIRMDGHMALANSLALKIAGVISLTEDPVGGTIMRMPSGEPTGLLIDAAMELVTPWVKEISVDERREALFRASKYALTRGVTTVIDLGRYFPGTTDELSWKDFQGAINCSIDPEWDELSYPHLHTAREKLMTL